MKREKRKNMTPVVTGYDYSSREAREVTVQELFHRAKNARTVQESEWTRYNEVAHDLHDSLEWRRSHIECDSASTEVADADVVLFGPERSHEPDEVESALRLEHISESDLDICLALVIVSYPVHLSSFLSLATKSLGLYSVYANLSLPLQWIHQ